MLSGARSRFQPVSSPEAAGGVSRKYSVPSAGEASQSTPLARLEPKEGNMTANRRCLDAIVAVTRVDPLGKPI